MTKELMVLCGALTMAACGGDAVGGGDDAGPVTDGGGGGDGEPTGKSAYLFDHQYFHHFEIELPDADWQWLQDNARLEEYRRAALIFEGERVEDVGLRFKGAYGTLLSCFDEDGTRICPKLSIKLSFTKFTDGGRFYGVRKLNFHSSIRDPSFMHEVIAYTMFRELGVVAPRASHAKVTVNGEYLGVFTLIEQVDEELLEDFWTMDEGNLYKGVWPLYTEPGPYVEALENNETIADVSRMIAFHAALAATSDETFETDLAGSLDLDYYARYFAVDRAISNVDGVKGFYCYGADAAYCAPENFYWYEEPQGGMHLLPWDLDYTFAGVNEDLGRKYADAESCEPVPFCVYWQWDDCDPATEEVFLLPPQCDRLYGLLHRATWDRYIDALDELARGPLSREVIVPRLDALRAKIRADVIADPNGPGELEFDEQNMWLDDVLERQLAAVEALVAEERP